MALSILNNISSLTAENALSSTQASLQKTLTQLSTGLKINSGADDAAGLSIANGMQANIAALTQSQQNASDGIGMLQTADGALSQVTSLLNRAVTLATEASNSTLNTSGTQAAALNTEYQSILANIAKIGNSTEFNGQQVFTDTALNIAMSDGTTGGIMTSSNKIGSLSTGSLGLNTLDSATLTASKAPAAGDTVVIGGSTYTFGTAATVTANAAANTVLIGTDAASSMQNLADAINGVASASGTEFTAKTTANTQVTASAQGNNVAVTAQKAADNGLGISTASTGTLVINTLNGAATLNNPSGADLLTSSDASSALTALTSAINTVAAQRGTVGAGINQLQSLSNVMNTQVQNLQSAENSVMNADIGKTVANMTQYNVLQSTGMAALQQSNQAQQAVLKLVQ